MRHSPAAHAEGGNRHIKPLREKFIWRPEGMKKDVRVPVISHPDAFTRDAYPLHLYLGLGAERLANRRVVKRLARHALPASGVVLPFHVLDPTPANFERTFVEVPVAVAAWANERSGRPVDLPVDVLLQSQGGGVMLAAGKTPEKFRVMAMLSPGGLTSEALGETPEEKRHEFKKRMCINTFLRKEQFLFLDPIGNGMALGEAAFWRIGGDFINGRLDDKLDYAFGIEGLVDTVGVLAATHPTAIFMAEDDPIFTPEEYGVALQWIERPDLAHAIRGSHAPMVNRGGLHQIDDVANWIIDQRHELQN